MKANAIRWTLKGPLRLLYIVSSPEKKPFLMNFRDFNIFQKYKGELWSRAITTCDGDLQADPIGK